MQKLYRIIKKIMKNQRVTIKETEGDLIRVIIMITTTGNLMIDHSIIMRKETTMHKNMRETSQSNISHMITNRNNDTINLKNINRMNRNPHKTTIIKEKLLILLFKRMSKKRKELKKYMKELSKINKISQDLLKISLQLYKMMMKKMIFD